MGRPSDLHRTVAVAAGAIRAIRIRGAAVALSEGRITIPEA